MPIFYLDLDECGRISADGEGKDHVDLDAAREAALKAARDVMSAEVQEGKLCLSCKIAVRDASGAVVLAILFRDAISLSGLGQSD